MPTPSVAKCEEQKRCGSCQRIPGIITPNRMTTRPRHAEFPEQGDDNRRIWDANARWWDDRIGDGNDFQTLLIEPATERLL
jgi:hypothetical protein